MGATILDQLADYARLRVEKAKEKISAEEMKEKALSFETIRLKRCIFCIISGGKAFLFQPSEGCA